MATSQLSVSTPVLRLPLTGKCGDRRVLAAFTRIPDDDFTRAEILPLSWRSSSAGYAKRDSHGQHRIAVWLHRVIFERYHGPIATGLWVDHIDRNPLNNMPDNLRALTHSQNIANRPIQKNNTSGYVGVYWHKRGRKWGANVMVMKKHIHLGLFVEATDAAAAVNAAYAIHFPHVPPPNQLD